MVFDDLGTVEAMVGSQIELDTCVVTWLRPNVVPFDDNEVPRPWLALSNDLVP